MFDLSDQAKVAALNEAAEKEIDAVIAQIAAKNRQQMVKRQTPFFTRPIYRPYYNWMRADEKFSSGRDLYRLRLVRAEMSVKRDHYGKFSSTMGER